MILLRFPIQILLGQSDTDFFANFRTAAAIAVRCSSGGTDIASVIDQTVTKIASFFGRDQFPECHLYFFWFFDAVHQPHPVYQTDAVGVCDNGRLAEYITYDEIGAFSSDSGEGKERIKIIRDISAEIIPQHFHTGADVTRFAMTQAAGLYNGFNIGNICICKGLHRGVFFIEILYNDIYAGVGTLGSQAYADEQFPGLVIVQCASGIRILLF